ncbi:MAG: hypothetical protein IPG45_35530 [Deltaproteobacteria bacterium]|nr:hypothetical protein [Deltaproteobacteria bacterium]
MRRLWFWSGLLLGACATPAPPPPEPPPPPPAPVAALAPPLSAPPPPTEVPFESYQEALIRAFTRTQPSRRGTVLELPGEPRCVVQALERIGRQSRTAILTAGLGRLERSDPSLTAENRRIELYAEANGFGPGIGEVLGALGRAMTQPEGPGRTWKLYDAVGLSAPVAGLQYFDLRPGGELSAGPGVWVTLYKVVPLSEEEMERSRAQKGDQWLDEDEADPGGAARALERWAPALGPRAP